MQKRSSAQQQDWKATEDAIALLQIFHDVKDDLLSDNSTKQRKTLKNEAEQQIKRSSFPHDRAMNLVEAVN